MVDQQDTEPTTQETPVAEAKKEDEPMKDPVDDSEKTDTKGDEKKPEASEEKKVEAASEEKREESSEEKKVEEEKKEEDSEDAKKEQEDGEDNKKKEEDKVDTKKMEEDNEDTKMKVEEPVKAEEQNITPAPRKIGKDGLRTMPCRFRSAFILFSSNQHKAIRAELAKEGKTERTATIAKTVSEKWRNLQPDQKKVWEEKARVDKKRYEEEMKTYMATVPEDAATGKAAQLPKRPMSAYLAYSNKRRAALKRLYPSATNAELSKMLSKAWKEASPDVKGEYLEEEARLRAQYNIAMIPWRHNKKKPRTKKSTAAKRAMKKKQKQQASNSSTAINDISDLPQNLGVGIMNQSAANASASAAPTPGGGMGVPQFNQQQFGIQQGMLGAMQGMPQFANNAFLQQQQPQQQQQQEQRASLLGENGGLGGGGANAFGLPQSAMMGMSPADQLRLLQASGAAGLMSSPTAQFGGGDFLGGYGGLGNSSDQQLLMQLRNQTQQQQQQLMALQQQQQQQQQPDEQTLLQQALMAQQLQGQGGFGGMDLQVAQQGYMDTSNQGSYQQQQQQY